MYYQIITNGKFFFIKKKVLGLVWCFVKTPIMTGNGERMFPAPFDTIEEARKHISILQQTKNDKEQWRLVEEIRT